ncbi:hypothetical protein [Elioraea sp.]|uniref:hypothetical protein n=1 Tax=Elioraea sp. TaxID=2185103 RepID=UPI0038D12FDB
MLGYIRDSFYRFRDLLYERGGELALAEMTKAKPNLKNCVATEVKAAVVAMAVEQPAGAVAEVIGNRRGVVSGECNERIPALARRAEITP